MVKSFGGYRVLGIVIALPQLLLAFYYFSNNQPWASFAQFILVIVAYLIFRTNEEFSLREAVFRCCTYGIIATSFMAFYLTPFFNLFMAFCIGAVLIGKYR